MGTVFTTLYAIIHLVVIIYLISLASRLVRTFENISDSVETIAKKKPPAIGENLRPPSA